jgi:hypothetical protein
MSDVLTPVEARRLIEARLGRPPEDAFEAAVVLEAWGGERAGTVFRLSSEAVRDGAESDRVEGTRSAEVGEERTAADGIATLLSVLGVAAWSTPLADALGSDERVAFGLALPLALAAQWAVRARYRIVGKRRLVGLRRDLPWVVGACLGGTLGAWLGLGRAGLVAALLVLVWAGGSLVARAGWAWVQVAIVGAVAVALNLDAPVLAVLGAAAVATALTVALALRHEDPHLLPGPAALALAGAASGLLLGLLLTADSTIRWGTAWVLGVALVPSVVGALWAGTHLSKLHLRVVEGLIDVAPSRDGSASSSSSLRLLAGAGLRYVGCCAGLSIAVGLLVTSSEPSIRVLLLAFGVAGILSTAVALLEALGWTAAALASMAVAAGTALILSHVGRHAAGEPVVVGAAVGAAIALSCAAVALSRPDRLLATRLWIV